MCEDAAAAAQVQGFVDQSAQIFFDVHNLSDEAPRGNRCSRHPAPPTAGKFKPGILAEPIIQAMKKSSFVRQLLQASAVLACAALPAAAFSQVDPQTCGSIANGNNGPFDYRVERGHALKVVEEFHFDARVEALISGKSGAIGQDLDYVLRVFPNHHRALLAMIRMGARVKSPQVPRADFSVECYIERALRFKPDDTTVRLLYASFLNDNKRPTEAVAQLDKVIELAKDNPFTQYNVGMVFAESGLYDRALQQAHRALAMGFTRPELRQRLEKAGKWIDPPEAPADAASSPASSPSQ